MEEIGQRLVWHYVPFTDIRIPLGGINILTVGNTLLVICILWALLWFGARKFARVPGRAQLLVETYVGAFDTMVSDTLQLHTKDENRHFFPLIAALFAFILLCNGIPLLPLPHIEEPTSDLNCTLALGMMVVTYSLYCGFKVHGIGGKLAEMCGPFWHHEGSFTMAALPGKAIGLGFFFPLAVVENLSRMMSISCRLFGNITGAAIILTVVTSLTFGMAVPLGLDAFFLVFESAVQAFVFSMLALIYIATNMEHE
jgi:F-type H+-transporting ATPase subunit a